MGFQCGNLFSLTKVNQELTQRNAYLEQQVQQLSEKLTDATKDSTFAQRSQMSLLQSYHLIPAKVVANSIDKPGNLMTIDKGRADGVRKDMGVVCGTGVVGIVYLVAEHYSVLIPVLNIKSNISCTIKTEVILVIFVGRVVLLNMLIWRMFLVMLISSWAIM